MRVPEPAESFVIRVEEVRGRLGALAHLAPPGGLTEPDPRTGERWDWGQVWAHLAEFPRYWLDRVREVLEGPDEGEGPPFGRTGDDPGRLAAIEGQREVSPPVLWAGVTEQLDELEAFLADRTDEDWRRRVRHVRLGPMDLERVVEEFLVGHLEEHAEQLAALAGRDAGGEDEAAGPR